ncbi:hypothetical protein J2S53_001695 [Actinopolyspora lacussalsi]|nr:hypothetical protein [Actinopolyspora lacussalsi]
MTAPHHGTTVRLPCFRRFGAARRMWCVGRRSARRVITEEEHRKSSEGDVTGVNENARFSEGPRLHRFRGFVRDRWMIFVVSVRVTRCCVLVAFAFSRRDVPNFLAVWKGTRFGVRGCRSGSVRYRCRGGCASTFRKSFRVLGSRRLGELGLEVFDMPRSGGGRFPKTIRPEGGGRFPAPRNAIRNGGAVRGGAFGRAQQDCSTRTGG